MWAWLSRGLAKEIPVSVIGVVSKPHFMISYFYSRLRLLYDVCMYNGNWVNTEF